MAVSDMDKAMAKRTLKQYCSSWDELRYDEIRNKPYFIGKKSKDSTTEVLFPLNFYKGMTFDELKTCIVDSGSNSLNLAVYNSDSTVVLYKAEIGLKPPIHHKESENSSVSDNANVASSSKKRKTDLPSNSNAATSTCSEQDKTQSSTCIQINLDQEVNSDLSETETEDSVENKNCSDDEQ